MLNTDGDLGRHLALGSYILQTRSVPNRDMFSFTRLGADRPPYEWLSQVAFAAAYRLLDLDGVVLWTSFQIAAAFSAVYLDALGRSRAPVLSFLVASWAAVASSIHWLTRPHVVSFLLLAIWILGLERLRSGRAVRLWLFPLLMLIWANSHGGFIIGLLALAAYVAGWIWQTLRRTADKALGLRWLLVSSTSLVASVITPDLWHNWGAVLQNRSPFVLSRTVETRALDVATPGTWPFLAMLCLVLILFALNWRRLVPAHVFLLGGLSIMSWSMERNIPSFAIAAAPILVPWLKSALVRRDVWLAFERGVSRIDGSLRGGIWPSIALIAAVASSAIRLSAGKGPSYHFSSVVFPVAAANWILDHPITGNMLNDFNWGGYLLFRLWPSQRVFIDSQTDFYGEELTRQYEDLITVRGDWQGDLERYDISWVLLPSSSALAGNLRFDGSWEVLYQDATATILRKGHGG